MTSFLRGMNSLNSHKNEKCFDILLRPICWPGCTSKHSVIQRSLLWTERIFLPRTQGLNSAPRTRSLRKDPGFGWSRVSENTIDKKKKGGVKDVNRRVSDLVQQVCWAVFIQQICRSCERNVKNRYGWPYMYLR